MPFHILCLPSRNAPSTGGDIGTLNTLVFEPSWLSSWFVANKLILHLFLTLLRLGLTLLSFICALYMVLSYCITVLNLASFSLLSLIYWVYTSYCYWKCILVL